MNKRRSPVSFRSQRELFHADTCDPLTAAVARGELRLATLGRGSYPGQPLPARDLRELCSLGVWDARSAQKWGLDWHRNEGIELTYLAAGHLNFAVESRTFALAPGSFTITRPWQKHRVGNPNVAASRLIWLILDVGVRRPNQAWRWPAWLLLDKSLLRRLTVKLRHNEHPVWKVDRRLAQCFEQLAAHCGRPLSPAHSTQLKILINELWVALAELLNSRRMQLDESLSSTDRAVRLFLEELRSRSDEPWTLEAMAEQCGIGRSRLAHYCRQHTNCTPIEYVGSMEAPSRSGAETRLGSESRAEQYRVSREAGRASCLLGNDREVDHPVNQGPEPRPTPPRSVGGENSRGAEVSRTERQSEGAALLALEIATPLGSHPEGS